MRIALFSDIHANLLAFEAMLLDMDKRKPDVVYCLGDLVGYNVHPNEVVTEIKRRSIATIAGNHDMKVIGLADVDEAELKTSGKDFAYHIITADNRAYLSTLPAHIRLDFQLGSGKLNMLLVHGSPRSVNEYVLADTDESYVLNMMQEYDADILCLGHSHKPYHRVIEKDGTAFCHIVNIGSVGKPKDGNVQGCYVMLTINETSNTASKDGIEVAFIRFDYDVETAAKAVENSPLPNEFADMLRKAY